MADIKISQLPVATVVNDADIVVLNQGGDTKTASKSLIVAGLATTAQISGLTSAQVQSLASAQIAAITPGSIGAVATNDIIGITKGGTGATTAEEALTALGGITSAQTSGFATTTQLSAYVPKAGATMEGRLVMAATTDQAKANIGGALIGAAAPASSIAGDVWVSNQSKLTFSPSTGTAVTVAGLSQQNTFSQPQTLGVGGTSIALTVGQSGTGRAATFAANSTAPAVSITQTGTGAALSVDSKGVLFYDNTTQSSATSHLMVDLASTVNQAGTLNTGVTPNTFTYSTFGGVQLDLTTIFVGTTVIFTTQADAKQNGPWIATQANTPTSGFVLTRPAWFSGTIRQGVEISVGSGATRSGYIYNVGKTTNGFIVVGTDNVSVSVVNYNQNALTTAQITGFATTAQLSGYATTTQIVGIATTAQLGGLTTAQLSGYATTTQLSTLQPALTSAAPLAISGGGTGATTAVAALTSLGALSATAAAGGDLSGNYPNPTVAKIQGQAVSPAVPSNGQVLTWNGSAWVPGAAASGGSGGGGVLFYFNYGTTPDAPAPAGAKELGRVAEVAQTTVTSGTLTVGVWTPVAGFVSDLLDPNLEFLPAGIFDFNVWCRSDANIAAPTSLRVLVNKWNGATSTLIATSGNAVVSNNGTSVQTAISLVIPQTDITPADRLYIVLEAIATGNGHTVTVDFGDSTPSHVHTTIPSVGGTGIVKVINGVPQNPASLITDSDVSTAAPLALNKVQMGQVSVLSGAGLTGGGNLSASRTLALATTGISAITGAGSSIAVPVISANIYGQITALTTEAIAVGGSGTVTSITAGTGLSGGTITASGTITLQTAGPGVLTNVGSSAAVPVISVDAYGRISALETASLSQLGAGTVTSIAMTSQVSGLSFTPTSAITNNGTFNLTGTLGVAGGGTGANTAATALTNLGGITSASLSGLATTTQLSGLQTALTSAAPLALAQGGTGAITQEDARVAMGGFQQVDWGITATITGTMNTGVTPNTFTYGTSTTLVIEGGTPVVGDTVYVSGQSSTSTPTGVANGPWIITQVGVTGVQPTILTRPTWFSGTVKNILPCTIKYGNTSAGVVRATVGATTTTKTDITVGTTVLNGVVLSGRNSNSSTAGNTYTGRQTFVANSTTVNPCSFQASTGLLTTPLAHAVEWDGTQMYVSNTAAERLPVATAKALINAQTGITYTITDIAGGSDAGKLITANNAAAIAINIPTDATANSNFPIGTQILVMQLGLGQVTVAAVTPGTTAVNSKNGTKTSGQYAVISLIKVAANSWIVGGDATT